MSKPLGLLKGFGIELEYMIVDKTSLDILPISDFLLRSSDGSIESEIEMNDLVSWSNELVLHVIELKTNGPKANIVDHLSAFQESVWEINRRLESKNACLLPGGMHPWMNPDRETKLWPHEYNAVYESFNKIFNCQGHGWSNLQSTHLNLSFATDTEFFRLHESIRFLLPIIPALTASSPFAEGQFKNAMDYRLKVYQKNCERIPSITGKVIPESVSSIESYRERILNRMYKDISSFDPDAILQDEWLNARGAIARFDRHAIEIRIIDNQENPLADLSICRAIEILIRDLICRIESGNISSYTDTDDAFFIFNEVVNGAETTKVNKTIKTHLSRMEINSRIGETFQDVLARIFEERVFPELLVDSKERLYLSKLLQKGCLARRLLKYAGETPTHSKLLDTYSKLAHCLQNQDFFE